MSEICENCFHKEVCKNNTDCEEIASCDKFLGWVPFKDERPNFEEMFVFLDGSLNPYIGDVSNAYGKIAYELQLGYDCETPFSCWLKGVNLFSKKEKLYDKIRRNTEALPSVENK